MSISKPRYAKPSLSLDQQLERLATKGMIIRDHEQARHALQYISYYRLSGYWYPFKDSQNSDIFRQGTEFDDILRFYEFDRHLRLLVLSAVERIEVAVRGAWAYTLAMQGDGFSYLDPELYNLRKYHENRLKLTRAVDESKDTFIEHYRDKYSAPPLPPVWMVAETMSIGALSRWYGALKQPKFRQCIAKPFALDEKIFVTFLYQLTIMRNIAAHHGRLWNRHFNIQLPKNPPLLNSALNQARGRKRRTYNMLSMIQHCLSQIEPEHDWHTEVLALIETQPKDDCEAMGFPKGWSKHRLWGGSEDSLAL